MKISLLETYNRVHHLDIIALPETMLYSTKVMIELLLEDLLFSLE